MGIYEVIHLSTELDILDLRLHEHYDKVEKFVIVEFPFDYALRKRPLYYQENRERFKQFEDKIIHHVDDYHYNGAIGLSLFWSRIGTSFSTLAKYCKPTDYVIVCDGDAYINKETFDVLDQTNEDGCLFRMRWSTYYFNMWYPQMPFDWTGGQPYSVIQKLGASVFGRPMQPKTQTISDCGRHWAKMGGVEKIIENLSGYPHLEMVTPEMLDPERIKVRMENGYGWNDIIADGTTPQPYVQIDKYDSKDYPKYLNEHPEIFSKYFKGGMN